MSADRLPLTEDELVWPTDDEVRRALEEFVAAVKERYGAAVEGIYLFGSRARGDHRPNSDADVTVVLADGDWVDWRERSVLVGLAYEPSFESGVLIQPWPVAASSWRGEPNLAPAFVRTALRDAVAIERAP